MDEKIFCAIISLKQKSHLKPSSHFTWSTTIKEKSFAKPPWFSKLTPPSLSWMSKWLHRRQVRFASRSSLTPSVTLMSTHRVVRMPRENFPQFLATKLPQSSTMSAKASLSTRKATSSSPATPQSARSMTVSSASQARLTCVHAFAPPRVAVRCQMELLVSQRWMEKSSTTLWGVPLLQSTQFCAQSLWLRSTQLQILSRCAC